jgi:type IV pilus assembly protein PilA
MTSLLKNKRGVTLVELLAVIIILGIIAAIAVPTIGNLIENQREKAALAEWTNVQEAARLYNIDEPTDLTITMTDIASYLSKTVTIQTLDGEVYSDYTGTLFTVSGTTLTPVATALYINQIQVNP